MSRFNRPNTVLSNVEYGVSANGNVQAVKSAEQELYEHLVSFLVGKDGFYSSSDEKQARMEHLISELTAQGKHDFIANSLVFARTKMDIRNAPILGLVSFVDSLRKVGKSYPKLRNLTNDVIRRADQITDTMALSLGKLGNKNKFPMAVKRGLGDAFNKFNEYAFAKYNRAGQVTFKDALRILHPAPKSEKQGEIFRKIMEDSLSTPDTWEVALSANGQKAEQEKQNPKDVWEGLIDRNSLGYQATLKNLRNLLDAGISLVHQEKVAKYLVDNVPKSKALPFEYLAAYEAIEQYPDQVFKRALRVCMDSSTCNLPDMGDIVVIMDTSGSMMGNDWYTGKFTNDTPAKQASFLAASFAHAVRNSGRKFTFITFDRDARIVSFDTHAGVYNNYKSLEDRFTGGDTNFQAALKLLSTIGYKPDTVLVLTDGEVNRFESRATGLGYYSYSQPTAASANLVKGTLGKKLSLVINMEARPTTPMPEVLGWKLLAGWSPKIFDYVKALAEGGSVITELNKPYPAPILGKE